MYSGIVEGKAVVRLFEMGSGIARVVIEAPKGFDDGLAIGASMSVQGVCLTVAQLRSEGIALDVMKETLLKTNLGSLRVGDEVNIERSLKMGSEIGGHPMSGHVAGVAKVIARLEDGANVELRLEIPEELVDFVFEKGFIGLNGCSLTVSGLKGNEFSVHLIPETLNRTTFGATKVGDLINVEIDAQTQVIVETVRRHLAKQ